MKKLFSIVLLVLPILVLAAMPSPIEQVSAAIRKGDATGVAKLFDSSLDITIMDDEDTYSKSQGEQVLKSFFSGNKPSSFVLKHDGSSPSGDEYIIGALTSGSQTFRVYVLFKQAGNSYTIQELRIEKD